MAKKIMICFDGTCNHPSDAKQEKEWFGLLGDLEDNGITNILKLHILFGGNLTNDPEAVAGQHSFYYSGVGTYGNNIQKIFNAGFSPNNMDVRRIIKMAAADLNKAYESPKVDADGKAVEGTGDEIFIFGFSRGAAIARRFASVIGDYIDFPDGHRPVRFLGVFDTVAAIGFPNLDDATKPQSDVVFEDHWVSPHVVEALHLVSADERRSAFMPTLMNKEEDKVTEIWFAGAHADVGGGFWFDGLSDVTLQFMIKKLEKDLGVEMLSLDKVDYDQLQAKDCSYRIDRDDMQIKPNIKGKSHQQDRFAPIAEMTLETRHVRVNIDDKASDENPKLHQSVGNRIAKLIDYRPRALKGINHDIVDDDGKVIRKDVHGVWDYIEPLEVVA
ncbi:MAG: DUF2235 domain-containing protein [Proteobacteria bacterium]|nr:DUF2235 domain-containing protein [Pseudomonadota bacterium]